MPQDIIGNIKGPAGPAGPSGSGAWTTVKKTADESRAGTTIRTADAALTFAMSANTKYAFRGMIFFDTGPPEDFQYELTGPATPTLVRVLHVRLPAGSTAFSINTLTSLSGATIVLGTSSNGGAVQLDGIVQVGATAGTFVFSWAQNTSGATSTIVRAGSYLEWMTL